MDQWKRRVRAEIQVNWCPVQYWLRNKNNIEWQIKYILLAFIMRNTFLCSESDELNKSFSAHNLYDLNWNPQSFHFYPFLNVISFGVIRACMYQPQFHNPWDILFREETKIWLCSGSQMKRRKAKERVIELRL